MRTILLLTLAMLALPAYGQSELEQAPGALPAAYLSPQDADYTSITTVSSTATTIVRDPSSPTIRPFVLPFGALVRFSASAEVTVCLTMAEPHQITLSGATITDANGPDGGGSCFVVGGSFGPKDNVSKMRGAMARVGARFGVCSSPVMQSSRPVYPACRSDSQSNGDLDCGTLVAAGTTCNIAPASSDRSRSGVSVVALAQTSGARLVVSIER